MYEKYEVEARIFPLYFSCTQRGELCVPERLADRDLKLLRTQVVSALAIIEATNRLPVGDETPTS